MLLAPSDNLWATLYNGNTICVYYVLWKAIWMVLFGRFLYRFQMHSYTILIPFPSASSIWAARLDSHMIHVKPTWKYIKHHVIAPHILKLNILSCNFIIGRHWFLNSIDFFLHNLCLWHLGHFSFGGENICFSRCCSRD